MVCEVRFLVAFLTLVTIIHIGIFVANGLGIDIYLFDTPIRPSAALPYYTLVEVLLPGSSAFLIRRGNWTGFIAASGFFLIDGVNDLLFGIHPQQPILYTANSLRIGMYLLLGSLSIILARHRR